MNTGLFAARLLHRAARPARAAAFLLLLPLPAMAYIDPASGMLLLQGLVALIAAIVAFVKNPVATIKGWLARRQKPVDTDPPGAPPPAP